MYASHLILWPVFQHWGQALDGQQPTIKKTWGNPETTSLWTSRESRTLIRLTLMCAHSHVGQQRTGGVCQQRTGRVCLADQGQHCSGQSSQTSSLWMLVCCLHGNELRTVAHGGASRRQLSSSLGMCMMMMTMNSRSQINDCVKSQKLQWRQISSDW